LKSKLLLLIIIVSLGAFLRLYKLDSIPPGLTWDEAALGYNAYSISKTLKDEYGSFLPLTLRSFGDYKPALYAYLDIPFVIILGLNEWAVRLPSVIAGIGFIILCFLITQEIFKDKNLSLSVAIFTSVSSLSIQFSRAGFESNIAVFLNVLGLYFFLKALKKPGFFLLSALAFSLSLLCYQASKLFVPIIFIGLFIFFKNQIKIGRQIIFSLIIASCVLSFVYVSTFLLGQSDRLAAQNFFAYRRSEEQINQISKEDGLKQGSIEFEVLHGEWFAYVRGLAERYLIYFSPKTLFVDGDYSPRHSVPDLGILRLYGLIFIPPGLYLLWRKRENEKKIILFWLFTASIPAVLSRDLISSVRALNLVFPLILIQGFGFYYLANKLSNTIKIRTIYSYGLLLCLVSINLIIASVSAIESSYLLSNILSFQKSLKILHCFSQIVVKLSISYLDKKLLNKP
jgi:4-amino-4-deoxy-L-arabinose transferase-like glycosyltransferase